MFHSTLRILLRVAGFAARTGQRWFGRDKQVVPESGANQRAPRASLDQGKGKVVPGGADDSSPLSATRRADLSSDLGRSLSNDDSSQTGTSTGTGSVSVEASLSSSVQSIAHEVANTDRDAEIGRLLDAIRSTGGEGGEKQGAGTSRGRGRGSGGGGGGAGGDAENAKNAGETPTKISSNVQVKQSDHPHVIPATESGTVRVVSYNIRSLFGKGAEDRTRTEQLVQFLVRACAQVHFVHEVFNDSFFFQAVELANKQRWDLNLSQLKAVSFSVGNGYPGSGSRLGGSAPEFLGVAFENDVDLLEYCVLQRIPNGRSAVQTVWMVKQDCFILGTIVAHLQSQHRAGNAKQLERLGRTDFPALLERVRDLRGTMTGVGSTCVLMGDLNAEHAVPGKNATALQSHFLHLREYCEAPLVQEGDGTQRETRATYDQALVEKGKLDGVKAWMQPGVWDSVVAQDGRIKPTSDHFALFVDIKTEEAVDGMDV